MTPDSGRVTVRAFARADEPAVLALLKAAFDRWPRPVDATEPAEFFRWKHESSPFGRSIMLVAEVDGALAGFIALMPWRLSFDGQLHDAVRGVDLAVDPAFRRRGISMQLIGALRANYPERVVLGWSNPNASSRRGVWKSGRREVGDLPRFVSLGRAPARALQRWRSTAAGSEHDSADRLLAKRAPVAGLLERVGPERGRIATARDPEFLRWRYGGVVAYCAVAVGDARAPEGIAIFRRRRHGRLSVAQICELLVSRGDPRLQRQLLSEVRRVAHADLVVCAFSSRKAAARRGFVRSPGGAMIAANPLRDDLHPDPTRPQSWALSLGDRELI